MKYLPINSLHNYYYFSCSIHILLNDHSMIPAISGEAMADYFNRRETAGKGTNSIATAKSAEGEELAEHGVDRFAYDGYKLESAISLPIRESPESRQARRRSTGGRSVFLGEEVVVCSSNAAFKQKSSLLRTKTKSRLTDQPEFEERTPRTGRGVSPIAEEEVLATDDDFPDEYKQLRYSKWTMVQLISLILITGCLAYTLAIPKLRKKHLYDLEWWKWEVMMLVVICGRLVSGWVIRVLVFFIERRFLLRKRVLYFVYGLKKAVQNCIWLTLVLIAWQCIFDKKVKLHPYGKKVLPRVTEIWICLLVGTLVWLLKTLLIEVLALNFHVSQYFDRIQDSLFNQFVIETLSGAVDGTQKQYEEDDWGMEDVEKLENIGTPRARPSMAEKTESTAPKSNDKYNGISIDQLHRLNQDNISAWNMKRMMMAINTSMLNTVDEQFQDVTCDEGETFIHIMNENQAKLAAKKIFRNVVEPGSKYIHLEDLSLFLRDDEALKTIRLFNEGSESKGISKTALKNWVVNVFRERRALALSLKDTSTAVDKLHQMLNGVVGILLIVISLLILKVATSQFFIFLSSQLVLVAFVFGNTCKTLFEAIIFLFVVHPFDVGDRCDVDGIQVIVEEMNVLTTTFLRYDNLKISYPNSILSTMPIANYNRSPDMGDAIDFCIHVSTPAEKVGKMKKMITSYVDKKSSHWQPQPMIVVRDVEDLNRLKISVWLSHRINFQDMGERFKRRALLLEEMIKIFKDLDIEYRMLPHDVNVRYMPELTSNRFPSNWDARAM